MSKNNERTMVFDNIEDLKWYFHRRLCKDSADYPGRFIMMLLDRGSNVAEINKWFKMTHEPYEVKT